MAIAIRFVGLIQPEAVENYVESARLGGRDAGTDFSNHESVPSVARDSRGVAVSATGGAGVGSNHLAR